MSASASTGRTIVLAICVGSALWSLVLAALAEPSALAAFRFILHISLVVAIYRGSHWARAAGIVVYGISAATALVQYFREPRQATMLLLGVFFAAASLVLALSRDVREFLAEQRARR